MAKSNYREDVDAAERNIALVLKDLEAKHPSYCVMNIEFHTVEVTNMDDDRARYQRQVVITLAPNATNEWQT